MSNDESASNSTPLRAAATKLGVCLGGTQPTILAEAEIAERIGQGRPYLTVRGALICGKDGERETLAEVSFPPETCAGHYPSSPSIPLVDMGRAMDQVAAISLDSRRGIPLLRRISKLRAESMEAAHPDNAYWVWARKEKGELITRLYSSATGSALASIHGWEYDFAASPVVSGSPQFPGLVMSAGADEIEWSDPIHSDQIGKCIPQTPPFLVLKSGRRGRVSSGAEVVQTISRFEAHHVAGHMCGADLLGPMHYSRSLAQSGMLLAALVGNAGAVVPEVVSAKTIWYDTREYFAPDAEVVTTVICDRNFVRGGNAFVTMTGVVCIHDKPVLGTDSFNYVLIPDAQHPATKANGGKQ